MEQAPTLCSSVRTSCANGPWSMLLGAKLLVCTGLKGHLSELNILLDKFIIM